MKKMKIFMGWDSRETLAYDVARHSILSRASEPKKIQIIPLQLDNPMLLGILNRPIEKRGNQLWCPISDANMSTEFAISRFAVPFLTKGWALFADCDIVVLDDIEKLFELRDDRYAAMVVKRDHVPTETIHMVNQIQSAYPRKNWSSIVLFNCDHPAHKKLSLYDLNHWPGRDLHAFKWLTDDEIGELPKEWNFLIGVDSVPEQIAVADIEIAHYTLGGPWLSGWKEHEDDYIWNDEFAAMTGK